MIIINTDNLHTTECFQIFQSNINNNNNNNLDQMTKPTDSQQKKKEAAE